MTDYKFQKEFLNFSPRPFFDLLWLLHSTFANLTSRRLLQGMQTLLPLKPSEQSAGRPCPRTPGPSILRGTGCRHASPGCRPTPHTLHPTHSLHPSRPWSSTIKYALLFCSALRSASPTSMISLPKDLRSSRLMIIFWAHYLIVFGVEWPSLSRPTPCEVRAVVINFILSLRIGGTNERNSNGLFHIKFEEDCKVNNLDIQYLQHIETSLNFF